MPAGHCGRNKAYWKRVYLPSANLPASAIFAFGRNTVAPRQSKPKGLLTRSIPPTSVRPGLPMSAETERASK